ncbi:hypothetical protein OPT61_g980 [Boeremia exigua]|uniref:Uncharacterized protein n=1 Tax=Boeremia exigua TaxID=749465 RepID=A0ACC2IS11_9PLEO|nr:hypothetical protein OPT61_g980 [Boeremia exigua]
MTSHATTLRQDVVPVDHHDPNHPHYPRDLEHQLETHRSTTSRKRALILGGIFATILVIVAAVILGIVLAHNPDKGSSSTSGVEISTNSSTSTLPEVQTVYKNATTFIFTTTQVSLLSTSLLATPTAILSPVPGAPLRPFLDPTTYAVMATTTSTAAPTRPSEIVSEECLFFGPWVLKEHCEENCLPQDDHEAHCEISKRSQWFCASCPLDP